MSKKSASIKSDSDYGLVHRHATSMKYEFQPQIDALKSVALWVAEEDILAFYRSTVNRRHLGLWYPITN